MKRKIRRTFRFSRHTATKCAGGSLAPPGGTDKGKVPINDRLRQVVAVQSIGAMWKGRKRYPWSKLETSDDVRRVQAADRRRAARAARQGRGMASA